MVLDGRNPSGAIGDACLDTAAHARRAARAVDGGVVDFRRPSLCRSVHCQLLRNEWLDLTTIIPTTDCHQRNYVEAYSRSMS